MSGGFVKTTVINAETKEVSVVEVFDPNFVPPTPEQLLAAERANMVCSKLQARIALFRAGKLGDVEALVSAIGGEAKLAWDSASEFRRSSPLLGQLAKHPSINMSDSEMDDLFRVAMTISV